MDTVKERLPIAIRTATLRALENRTLKTLKTRKRCSASPAFAVAALSVSPLTYRAVIVHIDTGLVAHCYVAGDDREAWARSTEVDLDQR